MVNIDFYLKVDINYISLHCFILKMITFIKRLLKLPLAHAYAEVPFDLSC